MGLDLLDIQFRIEKTFDIELSPEDFTALVRDHDIAVGDLYSLLLAKLHLRDVARYDLRLNYRLWEEMQGVLHAVTAVPLERVELKTPLESLFPPDGRRATWDALRRRCPYRIRELDYPQALRVVGFALAAAVVLIEQFHLWQVVGVKWLWPALGLLGIWMVSETYLKVLSICAPLRKRFPSGMTTVKDLCRAVLATNYREICDGIEIPFDQRCVVVWQQLTEILVDALGIDADQITFRSRLVQDLGAT